MFVQRWSCCLLLSLLLSLQLLWVGGQSLIDVGESYGWAVPPVAYFYNSWAQGYNFSVGDVLNFRFQEEQHDVMQVGYQAYLKCSVSNPYLVLLSSNNVVLQYTDVSGDNSTINFISGSPGDCEAGMRFSLLLHPPMATSSPGPDPAGPQPVPPPSDAWVPPPADFPAWSSNASTPTAAPPGPGPTRLAATGKHYSVGDTFGWSIPPHRTFYSDSWVSNKTFTVFDSLYFGFDQGTHTVLRVSRSGYLSCNTSTYLSAYYLGNPTIKLLNSGNYWFMCGIPGHCALGMKFGIKVHMNEEMSEMPVPSETPCPTPGAGSSCSPGSGCKSRSTKNRTPLLLVLGLTLPTLVIIGAVKLWVICCLWGKRQPASAAIARSGKLSISTGKESCVSFTLRELNRATKHFSPELEIGSGAFGTVYRGTLADGSVVAVKKPKSQLNPSQDFVNEVNILSSVNHRNLVRLVGCCTECEVPILVYEYIPNGTLLEHLQGGRGRALASWSKRLEMALETAEALAYLHSAAKPPIYHRDVKSSNILLDAKYRAKVADFGISRLVPPDATHVSTAAMGTFGYIDPEYHATGQLTDKSDVYSFGVVLLELITGQKAVDWQRAAHVNLAAFCIPSIKSKCMQEIVDPVLGISLDGEVMAEVQQLADLALVCLAHLRDERPSMKDVAEEVVRIKLSSRECRYSDKVKNLDLSPLSYDTDDISPNGYAQSSSEMGSQLSSSVNDSPAEPSPSMYKPR